MPTCLLVDDSRVIRKVARQIISELGFECEDAEDGQQALDFCKRTMPEAVLLDWNMPIMNGIEYLEAVRQLPGGDKPVIIFCTTNNEMHHIQNAIMKGANEYIMKPFDADIVKSKFIQTGLLASE